MKSTTIGSNGGRGASRGHLQLPIPVQADRVRASDHDGVLEIRLPKVEEVKPREIRIEVG